MTWYYVSFCDVTRPKGEQFLGATVVQAGAVAGVIPVTTMLGVNPGGEAAIVHLDDFDPATANPVSA